MEDAGQTRQSRRSRIKTSKAIELENSRKQHGNSVDTDPFASQSQRSNRAGNRDGSDESGTDNAIEVVAEVPSAPRPNRVQIRPRTLLRTEKTIVGGRTEENEMRDAIASILVAMEDLKASNGRLHKSNGELKAGNEELKTHTRRLMDELAEVKSQLAETRTQLAEVLLATRSFSGTGATGTEAGTPTSGPTPQSYASVLTRSSGPSSTSRLAANTAGTTIRSRENVLTGVTVDTRRMKDKSNMTLDNIPDIEKRVQNATQAIEALKDVQITGIQVRGHYVRILTSTERDATLLRINDRWVNQVFEGARTRGEDWHPVKIDDVVKAVVVKEDGYTIQDSFAQTFCSENGVTGVMKAFWLSKGNKPTGSMVVFLTNAEEAHRMVENRLVKIGGQVAFAGEFQKVARPTRCYNCNQYGHYQSRCVHNTTCGKCSRDHRTDTCTAMELKCPACGEAHAATDPGCPVYKREKANLTQASRHPESSISYA